MTNVIAHSITTYADAELARGDGTEPDFIVDALLNRVDMAEAKRFVADTITLWRNQRATIANQQTYRNEQLESEIAGQKLVITSLQDQVERLREVNNNQVAIVERTRHQHEADIRLINERFTAEAKSRGWCSEWEQIVEELNRDLHIELEKRKTNGKVQLTYTVTVIADITNAPADTSSLADLAYNTIGERDFFSGEQHEVDTDCGANIEFTLDNFHLQTRTVLEQS